MIVSSLSAPAPLLRKDALLARWANVRTSLLLQGAPANRAATEAACAGALEAWEMINGLRRRERAVGSVATASTLEAALRPLQDVIIQLLHSPGDPEGADEAVRNAQRSFETVARSRAARTDPRALTAVGAVFGSLDELLDPLGAAAV
ncbi:hypothetical protein [Sinomonas humi]|uniref:Uncharacterized protein n=1 Tax=Sinomonas humi TaxID=1338436 RepID=A0A0B2AGX1_9MICC|nr:hypothetical protein [Sinomonas humi]KHL01057.1 hypothetical protein LK10_18080 [Sinomonas humi]